MPSSSTSQISSSGRGRTEKKLSRSEVCWWQSATVKVGYSVDGVSRVRVFGKNLELPRTD